LEKGLGTRFQKTKFAVKSQSSTAGWIYGERTEQRKRMETREFNIATWNVRSMFQAGKMEEVADVLKKYNIQIIALQEMRWPQDGWIKKKNYTLFYSGLKPQSGKMVPDTLIQVVRHDVY
jgi:1,2-phenylacetyl-CoA epoxidase catalytic subunit